ncbi:hypothetical protein [Microbacterium sp. A93]|uniref:hypothetical protein n=1 Tax=Microbacterium sp. A93 TaxID=3450716 RepID=UPI003F435382
MTEHHVATVWRSHPELLVLNAVRLGGFAETAAAAERADLDADTTEGVLLDLGRVRLVERTDFADATGWILTDAGRDRLTALLAEERGDSGAEPTLTDAADRFEELNASSPC